MELSGLTTDWYLALSAAVFVIGAVGLLVRRNPLVMFMCVELMLNAVNVTFVALGAGLNDVGGADRGVLRSGGGGYRGSHRPRPGRRHQPEALRGHRRRRELVEGLTCAPTSPC